MTALIICLTIIFCVVWLTTWAKRMSKCGLPMFTYAACERTYADGEADEEPVETPIGFQQPVEDKTDEQLSDIEKMDRLLSDTASTVSALLRGEVDFDDIKN